MMNRFFIDDAEKISRLIENIGADDTYLAIPIYTPHPNMMLFEPYRATLEDFDSIFCYLPSWNQDVEQIMKKAHQNSIGRARERIPHMDLHQLWTEKQDVLYLSVHQDCTLYVGNSGVETRNLGDLRQLDPKDTAEVIKNLPGNYDYSAFYDIEAIPDVKSILRAIDAIPQNLVYGDFASILYRALAGLAIPTKLLF